MSAPLINKGERVIVDGQLICEAKHNIYSGEFCQPEDFQRFITPPATGETFDKTPGFRSGPYGQPDIFISGEWLSERQRND